MVKKTPFKTKKTPKTAKAAKAPKAAKKTPKAKAPSTAVTGKRRGKVSLTGAPGRTPARMLGRVPQVQWSAWKKASVVAGINFSEWVRQNLDKASGRKAA